MRIESCALSAKWGTLRPADVSAHIKDRELHSAVLRKELLSVTTRMPEHRGPIVVSFLISPSSRVA